MIKSYDKFLSKEVLPNANEIILEDTGLVGNAWGDGTHPSTNGLLNLILNTEFKPDETLLDWGTGSGVLSIFASKTKQIQSYGIELCIDSLNTAISNSKLNNVQDLTNWLHTREIYSGIFGNEYPLVDIGVANIRPGPLSRIASEICLAIKPNGIIALSGMRKHELDSVIQKYSPFIIPDSDTIDLYSNEKDGEWVLWSARIREFDGEERKDMMRQLSDNATDGNT